MVICPWCGTVYDTFQSNCKNCGGPIYTAAEAPAVRTAVPTAASPAPEDALTPPPPSPRAISNNYTLKLMLADSASIAGLVLGILGGVFTLVGTVLTLFMVTAFVGIPFAIIGIPMLLAGGGLLNTRYQEKQKIVNVLRYGQAMRGEITGVQENLMVRVNHRHPWIIEYQFRANGQVYHGSALTYRDPAAYAGAQLQPGKPVYVLYQPDAPEQNALYPHP